MTHMRKLWDEVNPPPDPFHEELVLQDSEVDLLGGVPPASSKEKVPEVMIIRLSNCGSKARLVLECRESVEENILMNPI